MKSILVPTDFSPNAEKAFRFALDLARRAKGTVTLYHTYIPVESTFVGTEKSRKEHNLQNEANLAKKLQRLKKKVTGDAAEVAVTTIVGRSPLVDNLLDFAEHNHIDMIIMGTQGADGFKKAIIGSVAARVVEKSGLPVMLIPAHYELETPRQIVFATNYEPADRKALALVDALAKLYNAGTTVLHFVNGYDTEFEKQKQRNDFDAYAFSLQREFNESKIKFHRMELATISESMKTLDERFPYDIMAMVRRKKTTLEKFFARSFTKNMAYTTRKPLLVVPESYKAK